MKRSTKLAAMTAATAAAFGIGTSLAVPANDVPEVDIGQLQIAPEAQAVDSFTMLRQPHSWSAVDEDTLIVWVTPWRPYLVELAFPAHDLKFAHTIGVTSFGSRVYAKFDSVKVAGFRYPIDGIYELTREEARHWQRTRNASES